MCICWEVARAIGLSLEVNYGQNSSSGAGVSEPSSGKTRGILPECVASSIQKGLRTEPFD